MPDPENEPLEPIDPPDNTGGGGNSPEADKNSDETADLEAIDPPDNTGGGRT